MRLVLYHSQIRNTGGGPINSAKSSADSVSCFHPSDFLMMARGWVTQNSRVISRSKAPEWPSANRSGPAAFVASIPAFTISPSAISFKWDHPKRSATSKISRNPTFSVDKSEAVRQKASASTSSMEIGVPGGSVEAISARTGARRATKHFKTAKRSPATMKHASPSLSDARHANRSWWNDLRGKQTSGLSFQTWITTRILRFPSSSR